MSDTLLLDTVDRLLDDYCDFAAVERAEVDRWCAPAWDALAEAGFSAISVPESAGGSGGSLADAMTVLRAVGRHAAPVPVAETAVLGGWLLASVGMGLPHGPVTVVPDGKALRVVDGRLRGQATVAWGHRAEVIAALIETSDGPAVVRIPRERVDVTAGANLAGEPRDVVVVDLPIDTLERAPAPPGLDADVLWRRGALTRVALMAGAAETMLRLTVEYTHTRHQFGQAVARFQAVQHHLVNVAQGSVRLCVAVDAATRAASTDRAELEIAAAKIVADEAAVVATRSAHQAHGAMGVTREYALHHCSRRLWAWRHEYGGGRAWHHRLGRLVAARGADSLFETITG